MADADRQQEHSPTAESGLRVSTIARLMAWELRGSRTRVLFWILCLAIGVGAVVGVAGLGSSLESAVRREARSLLAADLAVRSSQPLSPELLDSISETPGARLSAVREIMGVVRRAEGRDRGANSLLVAIKAIEPGYPFYGRVELSESRLPLAAATGDLATEIADGGAAVGQDLLDRLGLKVNDRILLGQERLEIRAVVESEPDRLPGTVSVGPRVFVARPALERSGITGFSGFTRDKTLIGLPSGPESETAESMAKRLRSLLGEDSFVRVETYADAQPSLRRDLERLESYLGLAALLSLLIGGVGIAQGVSSWIASRIDSLAILKCLGLRPREVLGIYLAQSVLLGFVGSLAGCVFGLAILWTVPQLLSDFVPAESIEIFQPSALVRGLLLGVGVATAFSLPPLLSVLRVPPSRVFRRTAEPLPGSRLLPAAAFLLSLSTVGVLAALQSGSMVLAGLFVAGVLTTVIGLSGGAAGVTRVAGWAAREWQPFWLRHGFKALSRPGAGTLGAIVALGLGLFVILTMSLVQAHLQRQIEGELPDDAPSAFMVDIRPEQWTGLNTLLETLGATSIESVPVIRAKIQRVGGVNAQELVTPSNRWALGREQRITYLDQLPEGNEIVAGQLWSRDDVLEVSLEEDYAATIGAELGDSIALSSSAAEVELLVTSLRRVNWEGFGINFFLVAEPGALEALPQIRLASAQLPLPKEQEIQDAVAAEYPNVLFIRIREMLDKILVLLGRLLVGVRLLGGFTVLSGLAILFGAVASSHAQRAREVALMKTLGMTRLDVLRAFSVEYALVGFASSAIATLGALVVAMFVVTQEMEIPWAWRLDLLATVLCGGTLLSVVAGTLASARALVRRPVESFREH